jgi:hypothetical protein
MISLIYVSTAVRLLSKDELLEILRVSRRNNEVGPVTGLLLYKDGNFIQVLEGPEVEVMNIFGKIEKDPRHKDITVICTDLIEERQFADWKMAFVNLDDETIQQENAYSEFLSDDFTADKYRETPSLAYMMLLSFKKNIR